MFTAVSIHAHSPYNEEKLVLQVLYCYVLYYRLLLQLLYNLLGSLINDQKSYF